MKKALCISIVVLHLLNVVGGYWIFYAIQKRNKAALAEQLDIDNYAGSQAITIKLPLSNFEGSDHTNYERVDGDFVHEGVAYRLVKQKFYRDTVYIVCYKDERTVAVKSALEEYVDALTDVPTEKKSESKTGFSFLKDYLHDEQLSFQMTLNTVDLKSNTVFVHHYQHLLHSEIDQPPELIS